MELRHLSPAFCLWHRWRKSRNWAIYFGGGVYVYMVQIHTYWSCTARRHLGGQLLFLLFGFIGLARPKSPVTVMLLQVCAVGRSCGTYTSPQKKVLRRANTSWKSCENSESRRSSSSYWEHFGNYSSPGLSTGACLAANSPCLPGRIRWCAKKQIPH